jgi:hypothetical protein
MVTRPTTIVADSDAESWFYSYLKAVQLVTGFPQRRPGF